MENTCHKCGCPKAVLIMGLDEYGEIVELCSACLKEEVESRVGGKTSRQFHNLV